MTLQTVLLIVAIVFLLTDILLGLRRGFFPALLRLGFVAVCALVAFFISAPLSRGLMGLSLPFLDGETLQSAYEGYLRGQEGLAEALALSPPIEQLVFHLPEVLLAEIAFVLTFFLLRSVTLPIFSLLSFLFFGSRRKQKKKAKEEKSEAGDEAKKRKRSRPAFRSGGMLIGLFQAVLCLAVLFVPIFGVAEFGERFDAAFADSDDEALVEISADIRTGFVEPINQSKITLMCEGTGLRTACVAAFHNLSKTSIDFSTGTEQIDYFEYVESMFPAISALLKLADVDPDHMTDRDYQNLSIVLGTAQSHEQISQAVKDSVTQVVSEYVEPEFRSSADVVVNVFTEKVVGNKEEMTSEALRVEVEAIQNTLKVMQTATSESAESAFEVVAAETLVDHIIQTEKLYDTLIEVANDPEKREVLSQDFSSDEGQKLSMKAEIEAYRALSLETRTPEEMARIIAITDALGLVLGVVLDPVV